jgi:hypothetical protein
VTAARRGGGMLAVAWRQGVGVARGGGIGIGMRLCFGFVIGR